MAPASLRSNPEMPRFYLAILAAAVLLGCGAYLLSSALIYHIGFPLDDSWIHLTYARNLALFGQWAFQLGHPSAGSTAPLWTLLLAIGFWLRLAPYAWTYFLGALTLLALSVLAEWTARSLIGAYRPPLPWVGLFFALEWHMDWAAMSGMETLLQALLLTAVLAALMTGSRRYLILGLLTGVSLWVRPDGLTLLAPVGLTILLMDEPFSGKARAAFRYLVGFCVFFGLYLFFNLWLSGTPMPNTFYAKQAEYAAWQATPLINRLGILLLQLFNGPNLLLVPGLIGWTVLSIQRKAWGSIAALLWCGGYLLLYISRLPAYQHGRYLMPAMPVLFLCGWLAFLEFWGSGWLGRYHWLVQTVWQASLFLLTLGFVVLGARSYGQDVGYIESEMVVTAKWVSANLPPQAVIAAHDIGALGYYDRHPLIDMAGLVSPEVIPFIRDEKRLAQYLTERQANYLIAFPNFYPELTGDAPVVYTTAGRLSPSIGGENMTVYLWESP